jgi:F0F1-type ATP synthase membrane subunit b/b'
MSFFDTNFAILLSFLIFIGLCWRYLAKPTTILLDQQIHSVTQEIHTSAQAHAEAQENYQAAQKNAEKVRKDILILHQRTQEDLEKLEAQAQAQLAFLMTLKDKAHQSKMTQLYQEKVRWLKTETAQQTMTIFQEIIQQKTSSAERSTFTDQMIGHMVNLSEKITT